MVDGLHIVKFEQRHLPDAVQIEREAFTEPWSENMLAGEILNPMAVFWAAELSGELAGYLDLLCILDEGHIANVAIRKDLRRRGIGRALLERAVSYAKAEGLVLLTLEVRAGNLPAQELYRSFGFERVGLRRRYYEHPTEDAVIMTRILDKAGISPGT